jgi:hypothetical protein
MLLFSPAESHGLFVSIEASVILRERRRGCVGRKNNDEGGSGSSKCYII